MSLLIFVNVIGNCFLSEYTDYKWLATAGNLLTLTGMTYLGMFSPFPHHSGNNMPDIATSPPRRGRGIRPPSTAGPTPTAVGNIPPGRGRRLRSFPLRRG